MQQAGLIRGVILLAALALGGSGPGLAQSPAKPGEPLAPNYLTSPYHGMRDGDGRIIPCRCRFDGREYRVGEAVCMQTHLGTVITRCDLEYNNTSWIPTATPCEVSLLSPGPGRGLTRNAQSRPPLAAR